MIVYRNIAGLMLAAMVVTPATADPLAMDSPTAMNGLEVVCTGIGSAKDDPTLVELSNPNRIF